MGGGEERTWSDLKHKKKTGLAIPPSNKGKEKEE